MNNGSDIRNIYGLYSGNSSLIKESRDRPGDIPEIGMRVERNPEGDNDGDRYYETWELYSLDDTPGFGRPLDWDYVDRDETIEDVVARVKRNFKMNGRPTL
jgi:hypothetical protein